MDLLPVTYQADIQTCRGFGPCVSMVCPWYANGNLSTFLSKNESLDYTDRLRLIRDIASGLYYLHYNSIIHGDLSGGNLLISDEGRALLYDFGLSSLVRDLGLNTKSTSTVAGSLRWAAPEVFQTDAKSKISLFSDIYSFGSVALQVFTGKRPYHYIAHKGQLLVHKISKRILPNKSSDVLDEHWEVIQMCWTANPHSRPSSEQLLSLFADGEEPSVDDG